MLIAMPNDAKLTGYRRSTRNPFEFDAVFESQSCDFTGSKAEFLAKGHAYAYVQIDQFTRRVIN